MSALDMDNRDEATNIIRIRPRKIKFLKVFYPIVMLIIVGSLTPVNIL
jgi:orotidine-5'-phosphate decarboxylase